MVDLEEGERVETRSVLARCMGACARGFMISECETQRVDSGSSWFGALSLRLTLRVVGGL
jgi:hypothetical protein